MIDFNSWERVRLGDVAEFGRAKAGHIYPHGASTFPISATRGQVGYLDKPGTVAAKDAVIIPQAGINPRYFNIVMQKNAAEFMRIYATGLNVQEHELANFPIDLHNYETQEAVVLMMKSIDSRADEAEAEIKEMQALKKQMLNSMMV